MAFSLSSTLWSFCQYIIVFYCMLAVTFYLLSDSVIFQPPQSSYSDNEKILKIPLPQGGTISAIYIADPKAKYTVLISHGNAEDLGTLIPFIEMFHQQGYSVLAYDYQGYGTSMGKPTEKHTYQDIEAAYHYLTHTLKITPQRIVLFGRSIGTGPTTHLATKFPVRALILESPFVSAYRVKTIFPLFPFDKYPNLENVSKISIPLLVIQGTHDNIISPWHGKKIYDMAKGFKQAFWVEEADHNDILIIAQDHYWNAINTFLQRIDKENLP